MSQDPLISSEIKNELSGNPDKSCRFKNDRNRGTLSQRDGSIVLDSTIEPSFRVLLTHNDIYHFDYICGINYAIFIHVTTRSHLNLLRCCVRIIVTIL